MFEDLRAQYNAYFILHFLDLFDFYDDFCLVMSYMSTKITTSDWHILAYIEQNPDRV